jgi:hypothetical protein
MKNNRGRYITNITGMIISFLFILSVSFACRDKKAIKIIPEKTFTAILSDAYLADGLLSIPPIISKYSIKDSTSNYIDIIESYGYSYEAMEKTLRYYYIHDPKRLISIYDKIDEKLSQIEMKVTAEQQKIAVAEAEYDNRIHFLLPYLKPREKPNFSFDINAPGTFTLEFSVTVYPDDQSGHPYFISWYSATEGPDAGKKNYFPMIRYIKDGWPHTYTVKGKIEGDKKSIFKGFYFDYDNNPDFRRQHAEIRHGSFSFSDVKQ